MKTMKNKIKQFGLIAGFFTFASCSDFLNQTSSSEVNFNNTFESVAYTGMVINSLYGYMGQDATYSQQLSIIWGTNSDCELIDGLGSDAYNTSRERGNMNYNASPAWSTIADVWDTMYGIIEKANLAIEGINNSSLSVVDNSDGTAMRRYKGEALAVRAMIYFDLIRNFGDVPMRMEPSRTDLSNIFIGKTDRDIIMDRLMDDLDEAIELLPWAGEVSDYTTERMTKGYAHALLANIALTRAGWMIRETSKAGYETADYSDAVYPTQRCDEATRKTLYERALANLSAVITSQRHHLNPSFENHWYLINQRTLDQTYRENIFEIPMGIEESSELGYTIGVRCNGQTSLYGHNSSGRQKLTAPYLWSFRDNDQRRDITCANFDIQENTNGETYENMLSNNPFGIYVGKWDVRKMSDENIRLASSTLGDTKWMSGINCVRMRYSQVLLMYAEVMNSLAGPTGAYKGSAGITAKDALEEVHNRAFANTEAEEAYLSSVSADKETFFNAIVDENAWELAGEGFRKYDLIRWNLLVEKILQFKSDYLNQMNGEYQRTIYYNYLNAERTRIDMSSITYKGLPTGVSADSYDNSASSWGNERTTSTKTQSETNLPSISSGLVGSSQRGSANAVSVKNRYLMPIASTTISTSNGLLSNSYGYSN